MFTHPKQYSFLGFSFNSLVDEGEKISISEIKEQLKKGSLMKWLKHKFGDKLDLSLFSNEDLQRIENYFLTISESVNEQRKFGVSNNGICLLVAYCFEATQRTEKDMV